MIIFVIIHVQLDIGFEQLVKIVKDLPPGKLKQLKVEIEKVFIQDDALVDFENLVLNGPVAKKKQLDIIRKNRKSINKWRTS